MSAGAAHAHDATQPLAGRVVLVVGAHGGLGSAASLACARAGATVVLLGRKVPRLNRLYDALADSVEPLLYPLDLEGATPDDHAELAQRIGSECGRLDALVQCAARFEGLTPLEHADPAAIARDLHVNLTAPLWLTQACLPLLASTPGSAVVWTVDDAPRERPAYWGGYGLAQAARAAAVAQLRSEWASRGLRVEAFAPGPMRTGLRARAFTEQDDRLARDPADAASRLVALIAGAP